jgi:chorismate mutase/prephenate dehydratase
VLASADISMTRIESRPLRQEAWDYVFFVDIDGHADIEAVRNALAGLADKTSLLKVLGSYPRAVV